MKHLVPLPLLFAAVSFVGCSQPQVENMSGGNSDTAAASVAVINTHCPIMGGEVKEDGGTVQWNGKTVGFCCSGCIEEFEALSDEEKAEALAKADEKHDGHEHEGEHDHEHEGDHEHEEEAAS